MMKNIFTENLLIYPNPTEGKFYVDLGRNMHETEIIISDVNGRVINTSRYSDRRIIEVDIDSPSGIYYIVITSGSNSKSLKVLKK